MVWLQLAIDIFFTTLMLAMCMYGFAILYTCAWWELPYVPTMRRAQKVFRKNILLTNNHTVIDMGSGLGNMLSFFSRSGARVIGIERNKLFAWLSRIRLFFKPFKKNTVDVRRGDFFQTDLSEASHVYCFHIPKVISRLVEKMEKELRADQTLISYKFPFPLSSAFAVESFEDAPGSSFYVYRRK
jgi:16S rRNA A1518/A1519 N6-dimethyltransferase RsmA/KsgA/DIM1 with predicted DNA glycosylase/AP lyase activity